MGDFSNITLSTGSTEGENEGALNRMNKIESSFSPGSLVWVPCNKDVWRQGVVSKIDDTAIYVKVDKTMDDVTLQEVDEEVRFDVPLREELGSNGSTGKSLYLRAAEQLSDYGVVTPDDLCELTHLHQPSILHAINSRFDLDKIYTFTGPILIAVNPYRHIKGYYGMEMVEKFRSGGDSKTPHVFNIANRAFENLGIEKKSQTILISGESGAGKTETTKFVLQFLTISGSSSRNAGGEGATDALDILSKNGDSGSFIEERIIQSNPLLESFGNSKTLRNDNSSRFGKFIQVWFLNSKGEQSKSCDAFDSCNVPKNRNDYRITSARINTYLLEKVRVCYQQKGERSFHIFYQLCSAAKYLLESGNPTLVYKFPSEETHSILFSPEERGRGGSLYMGEEKVKCIMESLRENPLEVDLSGLESISQLKFKYLGGDDHKDVEKREDLEQFERTLFAAWTMGISRDEFNGIVKVLKAVMLVGNIDFSGSDGDMAVLEESSMSSVEMASSMLSISKEDLISGLCNKKLLLREGEITKRLTRLEAETTRDSISRTLYSQIFDHVVHLVNKQISKESECTETSVERLYCGILDIFGFECFANNSFEQLCINFANERLQQIFNDYIFKVEQDIYLHEGIHWDPIDFPDNGDCVELLQQTRPLGIFPAIDEECFVPQGSNKGLLNKLIKEYGSGMNKRFEVIKKRPDCFVVVHYAGPVPYCVQGFIEKNNDRISQYSMDILNSSRDGWISGLLNKDNANDKLEESQITVEARGVSSVTTKNRRSQTLGASFRMQLGNLISRIKETTPHFIRCIKPNGNNSSEEFDRVSVSEQLKYGGVLQAVQVSRAGYPVRFCHQEFLMDYLVLLSPCSGVSTFVGGNMQQMRKGVCIETESGRREAIKELLQSLTQAELISGSCLSKNDGEKSNHESQIGGGWAVGTTRVFLKIQVFRDLEKLRVHVRNIASTIIQSVWRMRCCMETRRRMLRRVVTLQSLWRGRLERIRYRKLLNEKAALEIQRQTRGFLTRKRLRVMRKSCMVIQKSWRRYKGVKERNEKLHMLRICRIQATIRMYLQRRYYKRLRKSVLKAQKLWRGKVARREFRKLKDEKNEFSQIFVKYQEALNEIQRMKVSCSRLEDQLFKTLSERNRLKEEKETLSEELNKITEELKVLENSINSANSRTNSDEGELLRRLLRLSSYPFSKLGLLESVPEVLFPRGEEIRKMSENGGIGTHERQIGLLLVGTSNSGDKDLLSKLLAETGCGKVDRESTLQVFTMELTNIPGARVISEQEFLRSDLGFTKVKGTGESGDPGVRESDVGERWPLNIMSISGLENKEVLLQAENFLLRTRVAVFVYDVSNLDSFLWLLGKGGGSPEDIAASPGCGILYKAIKSGCKTIIFGNLSNVIENSSPVQVDVEHVRRLSCEHDIIAIESDSVSCIVYSIVGILNANMYRKLKTRGGTSSSFLRERGKDGVFFEDGQMEDEICHRQDNDYHHVSSSNLEANSNARQNSSLFSKFNDGIKAFGLRIPRFSSGRHVSERSEFLLPTMDLMEVSEESQSERGEGISPVINIKDEQNSSVTHIVFCRDVPSEPYTMLLVARKNGVIHAYYCYKTKHEGLDGENSITDEWSGKVEEAYTRKAHNRAITSLALSPDESEFLSTSIDMTVRRFLTTTGHAISLFSDNSPVLVGSYLPFLPSLFIVSSSKPLLRVVNVDVGVAQKIKTDSTIRALCFDSTGIYCFAACKEGRIYVLVNVAIKSGSRSSTETDFRFANKRGMQVCSRAITNMIYVHGASDYASIRRTYANGAIFGGSVGGGGSCTANSSSSNGGIGIRGYNSLLPVLVVNAADSSITIIDIRLQAPTGQIDISNVPHVVLQVRFRISNPHSLMPLRSCFTSVNGLWIASASEDNSVRVFQLNNESCEKESTVLSGHSAPVISTAVNASSTILASGDADGVVILWRRFSRF